MLKHGTHYEFYASRTVPNSDEVGYWVDLGANSKGKVIKVFNSDTKQWVKLTDATSDDAVAPYIGPNNNWFIDNRDTGINAVGKNPYVGDNGNWFIYDSLTCKYVDTGIIARGLTAYDLAKKQGFVGTEEEWIQSLKQPAIDAANKADQVIKDSEEVIKNVNNSLAAANEAVDKANQAISKSNELNDNPMKIVDNYWYKYDFDSKIYVNTNIRANGKSFKIVKIYPSVAKMYTDHNTTDVEVGEFVWINTGNVEDPDDSKLFVKTSTTWSLVGDLSGSQGIQGQSAYEIAVANGFIGSEKDWVNSLGKPATDAAAEALKVINETRALAKEVSDAEEIRVTNENTRVSTESTRVSNESARQSSEATRKKNETARETAESNRTTTFTNTINEVNTAKANAEVATTKANNAANSATTAASTANTATSDLRKLEQTVTQAEETRKTQEATRVQQEKSREDRTNKAISDTNAAKEATIIAKDDAIAATTAATEATNKANTATSNANTATTKANAATSSANTAASNANTQANRAKKYADNPPSITEDGYWQTFNEASDKYVKTATLAKGVSGVYVGSGDMPDGYNVQIDPTGDTIDYAQDIHQLEESMLAINVDRCGNLTAESIDVINIPKICGCPFVKIESSAPTTPPDFVGQMYIDTKSDKVYMATNVDNVSSYKVLN